MKKSRLLLSLTIVPVLAVFFLGSLSVAQTPIPNLQGTWEVSFAGSDTDWSGTKGSLRGKTILYIYQTSDASDDVPNLFIVPEDDPGDPFEGFVRDSVFAFYKNNQHGSPNLGRSVVIGRVVASKKKLLLHGQGIGFDSNIEWGSTWLYNFVARKISNSVPTFRP